ncbi:hypothetical protein XAP3CFBP6996_011880 [Xanthomonas citri pv. fuscans CFBP 6996]|uniref:hypothetical protein n=1 Tax=Xanthomonas citri TaxID=346 RepID=UPI000C17848C|nr:hypothetical protein [Xanthomonas citri]ATS53234.1 hypothetical protein XcfCFBP6992P_22070 [Xanthomonas citri pv. phaseoli var. fuscans]ATS55104.1 hypothetical protein XcfCFBP6994P_07950 [Xanthomonas citri pv. phaseoli var. fuscans]ATS60887.1 hypothetical protein XcfCFBP6996P_17800 [Xanthomonas citri pv. phaseoli var. fuscans]PTY30287.1 hypothetical protein XAP3CFBP6996_011880 [Xanthomonas citri pv. fuscans CFBP 6996]QWN17848.1 hypothetical protein DGN02_20210 [Xanthomonas citri]
MKMHWMLAVGLALSLCACQRPQPAPTDQKPDPQATALRDHIQQPLNKAHAVQAATDQAADDQRKAIDAATQ